MRLRAAELRAAAPSQPARGHCCRIRRAFPWAELARLCDKTAHTEPTVAPIRTSRLATQRQQPGILSGRWRRPRRFPAAGRGELCRNRRPFSQRAEPSVGSRRWPSRGVGAHRAAPSVPRNARRAPCERLARENLTGRFQSTLLRPGASSVGPEGAREAFERAAKPTSCRKPVAA